LSNLTEGWSSTLYFLYLGLHTCFHYTMFEYFSGDTTGLIPLRYYHMTWKSFN